MINWLTSGNYTSQLYDKATATYAADETVPESMRNFLARLRLLYGVPFNYLVPDSRLLPVESIRFFYIDRNFTDRLVDGALSVGKATTREFVHAKAMNGDVRARVDEEEQLLRQQLRGIMAERHALPAPPELTGLLLRSRAVSGWPGLEVKAYRGTRPSTDTGGGTKLTLLRMDRLAPDVMLCIFDGVPTRVDIEEPREGIQFGVDLHNATADGAPRPDAAVPSGFKLKLRFIRTQKAGTQVGTAATPTIVPVPVRKSNRRVIHAAALRDALRTALQGVGDVAANPGATLSSGELALELFQFPFRQRFEGGGGPFGGGAGGSAGGAPPWATASMYAEAKLRVSEMAPPLTIEELAVLFPALNLR
jgi:hypothetical protein